MEIYDVNFEGSTVRDGETFDKVLPGDNFEIEFKVKNLFDDRNNDPDIQDIKVELNVKDLQDDSTEDLNDDLPRFDLQPGEYSSKIFKFEIPMDVEDRRSYDVTITATGRDEGSAGHEAVFRAKIKIEKKNDDVQFTRLIIEPLNVKCDREITMDVEVTNFGSGPESDAAYSIRSKELGLNIREEFDLESDPSSSDIKFSNFHRYTIPDSIAEGKYFIFAKTFVNRVEEVQSDKIEFNVEKCVKEDQTNKSEETVTETNISSEDQVEEIEPVVQESPIEIESIDTPGLLQNKRFLVSMIMLIAFLALAGIVILYYYMFYRI